MDFRVEMIDPLTPDDELRYRELATTDQMPEFSTSLVGQKPDSSASLSVQRTEFSPALAAQSPEISVRSDQKTQSAGSQDNQETEFTGIEQITKSQDLQDTKIPYSTWQLAKAQQQHEVLVRPQANEDLPLAAAVGSLVDVLDSLKIHEPARTQIAHMAPSVSHVLAWLLESFSHEHIQNKLGFVISMLLSGYPPPPAAEKLTMLSVSQWNELLGAVREVRKTGKTQISSSLKDAMGEVLERLGHMAPDQWPFAFPQTIPSSAKGRAEPVSAPAHTKSKGECFQAHLQESDELQEARELWSASLQDLQFQLPQPIFDTWLRDSQVIEASADSLLVQVRNDYAVDWLQNRLLRTVLRPLSRLAGREMHIRFEGRQ